MPPFADGRNRKEFQVFGKAIGNEAVALFPYIGLLGKQNAFDVFLFNDFFESCNPAEDVDRQVPDRVGVVLFGEPEVTHDIVIRLGIEVEHAAKRDIVGIGPVNQYILLGLVVVVQGVLVADDHEQPGQDLDGEGKQEIDSHGDGDVRAGKRRIGNVCGRNEQDFDTKGCGDSPDGLERRMPDDVLVCLEKQESDSAGEQTEQADLEQHIALVGLMENVAGKGISSSGGKTGYDDVEREDEPAVYVRGTNNALGEFCPDGKIHFSFS